MHTCTWVCHDVRISCLDNNKNVHFLCYYYLAVPGKPLCYTLGELWPTPVKIDSVIIPVQLQLQGDGIYKLPEEQWKVCQDCIAGVEELDD